MKSLNYHFTLFIYYSLIVFISYTLMNKLIAIESFQVNLLKTGVFDNITSIYLSYVVVASEFVVLLFLLFKKRTGSMLLLSMLITFTLYITALNYFGRYEVCGCGGILNGLQFKYHLVINILLVSCSAYVLYNSTSNISKNEN
jgi:hypothetical protein